MRAAGAAAHVERWYHGLGTTSDIGSPVTAPPTPGLPCWTDRFSLRLVTPLAQLSQDEVDRFWALGIALEAECVPEAEWLRALAATRVQEVSSYSSMGTAETGWVRTSDPRSNRASCAVVPPGRTAEHTEWGDLADDRDTIAVCWQWFWDEQGRVALGHLQAPAQREAFLSECARLLAELEQATTEGGSEPLRLVLCDTLLASTLTPEALEAQLQTLGGNTSLRHLVNGVRARWLSRDVRAAYEAVLQSAERGKKDFWGHGNVERQRTVRFALLRTIVRLVHGADQQE